MSATTNLERRVAEHYASEPQLRAPDRVLHAALTTIDTTSQRRGLLAPWRFMKVNAYSKVAAVAVVVIAVAAIGLWQLGGIGNAGPSPSPIPSRSPIPSPTVSPSASQSPPLIGNFTSNVHGISMSFPAGWAVTDATTSWTASELPGFGDTAAAIIYDTGLDTAHLFMGIASQPLAGASGPAWADNVQVDDPCPTSEPIVVDGADGLLVTCNEPLRALFWGADRGYVVLLYRSGDEAWLEDVYDVAWFQEVLATVQIRPPEIGTADMFVSPFDYVLPGAPVFDYGATEETYWEVRVPAYADAGHPGGLIVQAIGGGRVDPCDGDSAALPLDPGANSVIQYLRTIAGMTVTEVSDTTVDGLPARQATVTAKSGGADCPDLWAWVEQQEPFITDLVLRLVVVDVDGEHVAVTIFGEPENPELPSLAGAIIGSLDFVATE
jgi:hypothetical protein